LIERKFNQKESSFQSDEKHKSSTLSNSPRFEESFKIWCLSVFALIWVQSFVSFCIDYFIQWTDFFWGFLCSNFSHYNFDPSTFEKVNKFMSKTKTSPIIGQDSFKKVK
jgi:hypothetical protein